MVDEPTGFAPPTNIAWQGTTGIVEYGGGDNGMVAMFYTRSVHNPGKSVEAGRPIHEDQVFVRIHPPGERLNIIDRPAKGDDSRRWPVQWAQFNQNKQQVPDGTPIGLLYPEYPSIESMLRAHGVHTIEQCAELSGPAIENIGMGSQRYVNDATKYLSSSNKGVKAAQFRHEMEEKDRQIRVLSKQVEDLVATVSELREGAINNNAVNQVQQLLNGMLARPVHPTPVQNQHPSQHGLDVQTAMINSARVEEQQTQQQFRRKRPRLG